MNTIFKNICCLLLMLVISGCSTHQHLATEKFNQLAPHYASIQQGKIEYYELGHGTPIVLIPGYATDVTSWNKVFVATLASHHRVIILNNRNVGGSHLPSSHYGSQDLANDTDQLIHQLHLKKPAVIGISMGGMIAQQLAIMHPNSVGQLILILLILCW